MTSTSVEDFFIEDGYGIPRNDLPFRLATWVAAGRLSDAALREILPIAWSLPEFPERCLRVDLWVAFFRKVGFISDSDEEAPRVPLTLYRGAIWSRRRGIGWTPDMLKAGTMHHGLGADYFEKRDRDQLVRRAVSRLQHLRYRVSLEEVLTRIEELSG